jgi:putative hydrolase of the HAD superfamily
VSGRVEAVLFDVGGVLVRLTGVERLREWTDPGHADEDIWSLWLHSASVRAFEAGQIDPPEFARRLIAEMNLPVSPAELLDEFVRWIPGLFPETVALLEDVADGIHRATLSNSNPLHWPRIMDGMGLGAYFDSHFVSHVTGRTKPDADAFEHALEMLGCHPEAVLFVDDNQLNVDAALRVGIRAHRTLGAGEAREVLGRYGVLNGRDG